MSFILNELRKFCDESNCCLLAIFWQNLIPRIVAESSAPLRAICFRGRIFGARHSYAQGGYEASYGTYQLDESAHTFTFHVEGALVRTLIGKDLTRVYEFSGNQLIVKSASPDEHWKVAWEHY